MSLTILYPKGTETLNYDYPINRSINVASEEDQNINRFVIGGLITIEDRDQNRLMIIRLPIEINGEQSINEERYVELKNPYEKRIDQVNTLVWDYI
ncbi:hypothetical protein E3N88_13065 [Mikania micrantha]|uniref:Uncharacterized protein n=1 Tax=Mikania micrantha TaxID=192012 RepID=A0A5N6PA86_9ASTR|nr:hypothetical protein E3N88_13065 [Mikania micrantha]